MKFGLHNIQDLNDMFWYMIPEVMIITYIMLHEIVERFMGLVEKAGTDYETVGDAIERIKKQQIHYEED